MRTEDLMELKSNGKIRNLKVIPLIRLNRYSTSVVPEIRLCGNWLQKVGFAPEQRVTVTTMEKLLIIRLEENTGKEKGRSR